MRPSSSTTTREKFASRCMWLLRQHTTSGSVTALSLGLLPPYPGISPLTPPWNIWLPVSLSTALKGSSNSTKLAMLNLARNKARATLTRAFCPPLRLMPLSPISVRSPSLRTSRSGSRQEALKDSSYATRTIGSSYSLPKRTLSRNVALRIHGD